MPGFEVPLEYDPILSKLVTYGEDRDAAIRRMIRALESYAILGVRTTIPFLIDLLQSPAFQAGETRTDFIERHFSGWHQDSREMDLAAIAYLVDELLAPSRPAAPAGDGAGAGFPHPLAKPGRMETLRCNTD